MDKIIFDEEVNCKTCKHGYHVYSTEYHCICGAGHCYMCAEVYRSCPYYEQGKPPEGTKKLV